MKGWKKPLLIALATAPIGFFVFSLIFMARYEAAFDETQCPFAESDRQQVSPAILVREDRRTCQPGVEERRWTLLRDGRQPLELGRRTLDASAYEGEYRWTAREDDEQRVRVEIHNVGHEMRAFREPAPDSGMAVY